VVVVGVGDVDEVGDGDVIKKTLTVQYQDIADRKVSGHR